MERLAFTMKLHPGAKVEYKRRHDELWPVLKELLKSSGISDYSIFLDEKTHILFGVLKVNDASQMHSLAEQPVMREWWDYMKDLMECNDDNSPVTEPLEEVFYLP